MRCSVLALMLATGCITTPGLIVDKTGPGEGRVVSDRPGIDCGPDCGDLFDGPVTLTATPTASSVFAGWSGVDGCAADPTCTFEIETDLRVEAMFDHFYPTLTVTPVAHGVVHARGIDCGSDCSESYEYETFVTLSVTTEPGWAVTGWSGATCTLPACAVTITEDRVITPVVTPQ